MNLGLENFQNWNTDSGPNNSDILQKWFPQEIKSAS